MASLLTQQKFAEAYDLFDTDFQNRVSKQPSSFISPPFSTGNVLPPIDGISWNGLAEFHSGDDGVETADSVFKIHYKGLDR